MSRHVRPCLHPLLARLRLVAVTLLFLASGQTAIAAQVPLLSIGLQMGQRQVVLGSNRGFEIQDPGSGRTLRRFAPGRQVRLRSRGGGIGFGGKMTMLRLVVKPYPGSLLALNNQYYRGYLEIREEAGGKITIANVIDVESYLYSVVNSEMPSGAPLEAYKAQAIIARTFALKNRDDFSQRGFGLKATEESQVYVGVKGEAPLARQAVEQTRGLVLSYAGQLANVFYSAACGGATETNDAVWDGSPEPYLRPVACSFCQAYNGYRWQADLPFDEISRKLRAHGWPVGRIQSIQLARSASGRVKTLIIRSDRGEATVPANKFRLIMGHRRVKSTRFTVMHQLAQAYDAPRSDVPYDEAGENAIRSIIHHYIDEANRVSVGSSSGRLRITGTGYGHGVGLCQWGAKQQAQLGRDCRQILGYYFGGTCLARAYR